MDEKRKMTNIQAITEFMVRDGGKKPDIHEFKKLTREDRDELGALSAAALGDVEITKAV